MSDQHPTEPQPTKPHQPQPEPEAQRQTTPDPGPARRRLYRSRHDGIITGIAGGLGDYFNVDPVIVRIAFAASVFLGGLGIFVYLAMWIFVPAAPLRRGDEQGLAISGRPRGAVLIRVALASLALAALACVALFSAWAAATGHGVAIAIAVILLGAVLAATASRGDARWLIIPAIALAAPVGVVAAADISFADGIGERQYAPNNLDDLPADGYELGIGRIVVDLRDADWKPGSVKSLDLDLGVGELVVAVPPDVCVSSAIDADAGELQIPGQRSDGFDPSNESNTGSKATPRLELTAHVDLGRVEVTNDPSADLGSRSGADHRVSPGSATDLRTACASGKAGK